MRELLFCFYEVDLITYKSWGQVRKFSRSYHDPSTSTDTPPYRPVKRTYTRWTSVGVLWLVFPIHPVMVLLGPLIGWRKWTHSFLSFYFLVLIFWMETTSEESTETSLVIWRVKRVDSFWTLGDDTGRRLNKFILLRHFHDHSYFTKCFTTLIHFVTDFTYWPRTSRERLGSGLQTHWRGTQSSGYVVKTSSVARCGGKTMLGWRLRIESVDAV